MKLKLALTLLPLLAALSLPGSAKAQEQLSRSEALKYAFTVASNLAELLGTPILTDPDVKRPVAVRDGDYGGLILPESKLTSTAIENAGQDCVPVAQLWLLKLVPMSDGQPVSGDRLRFIDVSNDEGSARVPCCAVAVRKASSGLELVLLGKDKTPLLSAPLKPISKKSENPVDMMAERNSDGGLITLRLMGKYEAAFMVTDPDA